mgnify:CR=1 FL=1
MPAKIRGELYDMQVGYPGLRLKGVGWVYGYLMTFFNEADFLRLDYLEGYEPQRAEEENEYLRLKIPCYDLSSTLIGDVWAYEITTRMMEELSATRIPDGNWPV